MILKTVRLYWSRSLQRDRLLSALVISGMLFGAGCNFTHRMSHQPASSPGVQHAYTANDQQAQQIVTQLNHEGQQSAQRPIAAPSAPPQAPALPVGELALQPPATPPLNVSNVVPAAASTPTAMPSAQQAAPFPEATPVATPPQTPIQANSVQQISAEYIVPNGSSEGEGVACPGIPLDCEPRGPVCHPGAFPAHCPPNTGGAFAIPNTPEFVGDEYVCDGGDTGLPVHYNGHERMGLNTEDTVAEFVDHNGDEHVKASTRVCIYAPRFASVRNATAPQQGYTIDKVLGHQDQTSIAGFDTKQVLDEKVQLDEVRGLRMRSRSSGVEAKTFDGLVDQSLKANVHERLLGAYEDFRFIKEGQFDRADGAIIELAIAAALEWADDQGLQIYANDQSGQQVQGRFTAQDFTGVEDRRTKGDLQIVKVADKKVAQPGDVVTFTIRFDNTGDRELLGIRIVDNLSPRLEFVPESVDSDRDGKIDVEPNGEGGQVLSFEFAEPLAGKTGSYVKFQCRVR